MKNDDDTSVWMITEFMKAGAISKLLRIKSTYRIIYEFNEEEIAYVAREVLIFQFYHFQLFIDSPRTSLPSRKGHLSP
jgi:hypothetical protein